MPGQELEEALDAPGSPSPARRLAVLGVLSLCQRAKWCGVIHYCEGKAPKAMMRVTMAIRHVQSASLKQA